MDEFADKVVLITGAGRGHAREIALSFSSLGASVAANDINPTNLDDTISQIRTKGGKAEAFIFDIAKRMPIEAMVSQVVDHFGRIDVLVNHASIQPRAFILDMDEWEFHRTIDVNLGGPFFTMQQVGRVMQQQGGGSIVNLISALESGFTQAGYTAYHASQSGLIGLTQASANELSVFNIRVNAVCLYPIQLGTIPSQSLDEASLRTWLESYPQARQGDYPSLVSLVLYLCSQAACSLTGQVLTINPEK
jgi:NAD(P)-dependent dehydrogenase (short-subunit alcohol dehydrogenase family)